MGSACVKLDPNEKKGNGYRKIVVKENISSINKGPENIVQSTTQILNQSSEILNFSKEKYIDNHENDLENTDIEREHRSLNHMHRNKAILTEQTKRENEPNQDSTYCPSHGNNSPHPIVPKNTTRPVITEMSNPEDIKKVLKDFKPNRSLDLHIIGSSLWKTLPSTSSTDCEATILRSLRELGLVFNSTSETPGGVSYDVTIPGDQRTRRLPPKLAKIKRKHSRRTRIASEPRLSLSTPNADNEDSEFSGGELRRSFDTMCLNNRVKLQEKQLRAAFKREEQLENIRERQKRHLSHISKVQQRRLLYRSPSPYPCADFYDETVDKF